MRLIIAFVVILATGGCAETQTRIDINKENQAKLNFTQQNYAVGKAIDNNNVSIVYSMPQDYRYLSQRNFGVNTTTSESEHIRHWDMMGVAYTNNPNDKESTAAITAIYKSYCETHDGAFESGICRRVTDQSFMFRIDMRTRNPQTFGSIFRSDFDLNVFEWKKPDQQNYFSSEYLFDPTSSAGYSGMYVTQASRLAEYRRNFLYATTPNLIDYFISKYQNNDPEGLVPKIRERLQQIEAEKAKAEDAEKVRMIEQNKRVIAFRKSLADGDETNCGPVIEIKGTLIKVSHAVAGYGNEHWIRREQIFPSGYGCRFVNGQYQLPEM